MSDDWDRRRRLREEIEAKVALGVFIAEIKSTEDQLFPEEREEYKKLKGTREGWEFIVRTLAEHGRDAAKIFGEVYFGEKP